MILKQKQTILDYLNALHLTLKYFGSKSGQTSDLEYCTTEKYICKDLFQLSLLNVVLPAVLPLPVPPVRGLSFCSFSEVPVQLSGSRLFRQLRMLDGGG